MSSESLLLLVCSELENHLGVGDPDLAGFVIDLAEDCRTQQEFTLKLAEKRIDFPQQLAASIFNLVHKFEPDQVW